MFRNISDCEESKAFYLHNGRQLRNLVDLNKAFEDMDDATFSHHVTKENNDFSNWIKDVLNEQKLARDLKHASSRNVMQLLLKKRLAGHAVKNLFYAQ